ncbi:MAG: hypothetical protein SGPRY_012308, partial [Prymnesium sp.]
MERGVGVGGRGQDERTLRSTGGAWPPLTGTADISHDGVKDLIIGRDDGQLEARVYAVWSFDVGTPKLVFERALQESVTSVECGLVTNANYEEVVLSTYSGKVELHNEPHPAGIQPVYRFSPLSSCDEENALPDCQITEEGGVADAKGKSRKSSKGGVGGLEDGSGKGKERGNKKLLNLRQEIEQLHEKVAKEKEEYGKISESLIAADVQFKMKDKWTLKPEEACYQLHVELSMPLDTLLLQARAHTPPRARAHPLSELLLLICLPLPLSLRSS